MKLEMVICLIFYIIAHIVAVAALIMLSVKDDKIKREMKKNNELCIENKKLQVLNLYLKKKLNFKSIQESEQNVR